MHLGSIYLVANDFDKSIVFYEKFLDMPLSSENNGRFVGFMYKGFCISLFNGHFDVENPDKVENKGGYSELFNDFQKKALAPNTHKFVLNFCADDLLSEYERIKSLNITENLSDIKYVNYVAPYYFFCLTDPDDNIIEVTGGYTPISDKL